MDGQGGGEAREVSDRPPKKISSGQTWSQSYNRELQRQRCKKKISATSSLVRFENKKILFYFEKRSSQLQLGRCSCKFRCRRIGLFLQLAQYIILQIKSRKKQQCKFFVKIGQDFCRWG
jgi:hypothetical protein